MKFVKKANVINTAVSTKFWISAGKFFGGGGTSSGCDDKRKACNHLSEIQCN